LSTFLVEYEGRFATILLEHNGFPFSTKIQIYGSESVDHKNIEEAKSELLKVAHFTTRCRVKGSKV
jgi:hypothetical protein